MNRTTYTPEPDTAAAIRQVREELHVGPSEAINILIRRGLSATTTSKSRFQQASTPMGSRVSVANVGAVEAMLDESR